MASLVHYALVQAQEAADAEQQEAAGSSRKQQEEETQVHTDNTRGREF